MSVGEIGRIIDSSVALSLVCYMKTFSHLSIAQKRRQVLCDFMRFYVYFSDTESSQACFRLLHDGDDDE